MTWFAFKGYNSGNAIDLAGVQEKEAVGLGFHGYATAAQADSNPNSVNLLQKAIVDGFIADYKYAVAAKEEPGGSNADILNPANDVSGAASAAESSIPGLSDIGSFFDKLGEGSTWIRVGEVVAGLLLVYIGLRAATQPGGASSAASSATKGVKKTSSVTAKFAKSLTPTARAASTVERHRARAKSRATRTEAEGLRTGTRYISNKGKSTKAKHAA